ncbi:hypothetical protein [Erysipelothrix aquatica]|uniref:hypothetical protein n=1 Tax=Erysipelothrix aquatica TaxID=2683714 RepID=UPI00135856CE|nr:hypothetical protein [Erysipelothrix aquatica]
MNKHLNGVLSVRINDDNRAEAIVYGRPTPVRKLKRLMNANFKKHRFIKASWSRDAGQSDVMKMVDSYLEYVTQNKLRKYTKLRPSNKTYEAIQGWNLNIMVDHHLDKRGLIRFVDTFMSLFSGGEKLAYVAFEAHEGEFGRYIQIWICDYEYTGKARLIKKRYERNAYRNKITKQFCNKDDKNAEQIYKRGDFVKDKDGNTIESEVYFATRKCATLAHEPEYLYGKVRQCILNTYAALQTKHKPKLTFKRFQIWWGNEAKLNKIYTEINRTQNLMERLLMYYLEDEMHEDIFDDDVGTVLYYSQGYDEKSFKLSKIGRHIKSMFYRYYGAFKNHHFTDTNGERVSLIASYKGRDTMYENIEKLWHRFKTEMMRLVSLYNLKEVPFILTQA